MDLHDATRPEEGGETRLRRAMAHAERTHRRRRGYAVIAGAVVAMLLVVVALGALARELTSPAAAQTVAVRSPESLAPTSAVEPDPRPPATPSAVISDTTAAAVPAPRPTPAPAPKPRAKPAASSPTKRIRIRIGATGYEPSTVSAKAGTPIVLMIDQGEGCAAGFLLPSLGVERDNSSGPVTVTLGRLKPGTYRFTCGMGMVEGRLVIT